MIIGVPKEIKNNEYRVSITPGGVYELKNIGHQVFIQDGAGLGSGYTNEEYINNGAVILNCLEDVYSKAEMIVKVKEPLEQEYKLITKNMIL